jgi:hypothetical protein
LSAVASAAAAADGDGIKSKGMSNSIGASPPAGPLLAAGEKTSPRNGIDADVGAGLNEKAADSEDDEVPITEGAPPPTPTAPVVVPTELGVSSPPAAATTAAASAAAVAAVMGPTSDCTRAAAAGNGTEM